jgi:hypothetical protein
VTKIVDWIKANKLLTVLLVVIVWLAWPKMSTIFPIDSYSQAISEKSSAGYGVGADYSLGAPTTIARDGIVPPTDPNYPPQNDTTDRKVAQTGSVAMVVNDVKETESKITSQIEGLGGYMVNTSVSYPEETPYAYISVRVPSDKLTVALDFIKSLGLKVTSESLYGQDVTDQYTDIDAHIAQLNETKLRYEEIRAKATEVTDLVSVQQQLTNIQTQIDSYKGQQRYLEQTAKLALISVTLSTDELALPYTPTDTFRPAVIFKEAVRGLYGHLRDFAANLIWLGVYSVIWLPILVVVVVVWKKYLKNSKNTKV